MNEKRQCSILFHLFVPGANWWTSIDKAESLPDAATKIHFAALKLGGVINEEALERISQTAAVDLHTKPPPSLRRP